MSYSIIIPAFNEVNAIPTVLTNLTAFTTNNQEIIVVDDCSTDNTVAVIQQQFPTSVRVIRQPHNQGPIAAIVAGMRAATHEVIVTMDADGQHPIEYLPQVVGPVLENDADIVLGVRASLPRLGENIIARFSRVTDATTGFKAMKKELAPLVADDIVYGGMLITKARAQGLRIREVPITVHERISGASVHSNMAILKKSLKYAWWATTRGK